MEQNNNFNQGFNSEPQNLNPNPNLNQNVNSVLQPTVQSMPEQFVQSVQTEVQPVEPQQAVQPVQSQTVNNYVEQQPTSNDIKPPFLKIGLIVGGIVLAIIALVIVLTGKDNKSENKTNSILQNGKLKEQVFLNQNQKTENKLSIIINRDDEDDDANVFIGVNLKGISKDLEYSMIGIRNDAARFTSSLEFNYDDGFYDFGTESENYSTKNNKTMEYIDGNEVLFKSNGYYIANTNIDKVTLYYKYDSFKRDDFDGEKSEYWYLFRFGFYDDIETAKEKLAKIEKELKICTYTNEEGIDNCKDYNGQIIDYKEYRHLGDMVINLLKEYDLYAPSYKDVRLSRDGVIVYSKPEDSNGEFVFTINAKQQEFVNKEDYKNFKLDGKDFYISDNRIMYESNDYLVGIYVSVPYGVENTEENIIKEFTRVFSKYK